jgi:DNA-binding response OmpR family regulator
MLQKNKILLIEDDVNLGFLLVDFLESNNFDVKLYNDGESGLRAFINNAFDFCIIDIMLPKLDGYSIVKHIRQENKLVPIIFLTAKSMKVDKIKGFEHGIDDYVTKPFDEDELLCRIRAILNRSSREKLPCQPETFKIGKYTFESKNQLLILDNTPRRLTVKESDVLRQLCLSKNNIVKRETILVEVWGENDYFLGRSLDVFIAKLRKYLKDDPSIKIENVPTVGFILSDGLKE